MKILIVEDDFSSRKLMGMYLKNYGEIDFAVNGEEAVEAFLNAANSGEKYDIIFLDIMLPEISGHKVLEEIKKIEEEREIFGTDGVKVVMTTALDDSKNIKDAFRGQCDEYLTKPISAEKVERVIKKLMNI